MTQIPRPALALGLAGLLPFVWGALGILIPNLSDTLVNILGARFNARFILISYGTVILCFMSGVLWGFATKTNRWTPYALSTLPALWAFFTIGGGETKAISAVLAGFIFVFACDVKFAMWGLTPTWWLKLRTMLTLVVMVCLLVGLFL